MIELLMVLLVIVAVLLTLNRMRSRYLATPPLPTCGASSDCTNCGACDHAKIETTAHNYP